MGVPQELVIAFFGGLKTAVAADKLQPNEAVLLENMETSTGDLRTRAGWKKRKSARIDSTRPIIDSWRVVKVSTGTKKEIVHTRNKLWTLSGSAVASITGSYSLTSGWAHTAVVYQDTVYGGNGVDTGWSWGFSSKVASYGTPSSAAKFTEVFEEKLVFGCLASAKNRFEWTDEGLPTTRQTLNFAFYPPDRSDELTLMKPLGAEVILGTPLRIGKTVGGLPPRAIVDIDLGHGCVSQWSAAILNGWMYFVGYGGIYRTDGNVVQEVSGDLDTSDITITSASKLRGCARDGRYYDLSYISVAAGGSWPNRVLTYDSQENKWYGPHKLKVASWFEWRTPGDDGRICGGNTSGYAATFWNGNSDAGTVITGVYKGPVLAWPETDYLNAIEEVSVHVDNLSSGTATLGLYKDRKGSASTVGTISLAASGAIEGDRDSTTLATRTFIYAPKKPTLDMVAREWQPKIRVQAKGQPVFSRLILRGKQYRST